MPSRHNLTKADIVEIYRKAGSLRDAAARIGISMQRVHAIVTEVAPEALNKPHDIRRIPRSA